MDRFGRAWLVPVLRGMAVVEGKVQARSGKDGKAVSEGNGSVLWVWPGCVGLGSRGTYWQRLACLVTAVGERTGLSGYGTVGVVVATIGSHGESCQGDAWPVWAVE